MASVVEDVLNPIEVLPQDGDIPGSNLSEVKKGRGNEGRFMGGGGQETNSEWDIK